MDEKLEKVKKFVENWYAPINGELKFHNIDHTNRVAQAATKLAIAENRPSEDIEDIQTAAYLHDIGNAFGRENHEYNGAIVTRNILPEFGYTPEKTNNIADLMMVTKLPNKPKTLNEMILADADLSHLGGKDYFETAETLRQELGVESELDWHKGSREFMKSHSYYTKSANNLYLPQKTANLEALEAEINRLSQI